MIAYAAEWASVISRHRVWMLMAGTDIAMRYRRSLLGPFWISLAMAAMVLTIGALYSDVLNQPYEAYVSYLGCGLLVWTFLSTVINDSCSIAIEAAHHLRSVNVPVPVLSARMVYRNLIIFLHNAVVILTALLLLGHTFAPTAWLAILGVCALVLLGWFVGVTLAPICLRFRDLASLISSIIQIAFFVTPIFWMPDGVSRPFVVTWNPFFHLIEVVRRPLLGGGAELNSWIIVGATLCASGVAAVISLALCRRKMFLWL
jgi:lipopolysaccharide transport system permease protein